MGLKETFGDIYSCFETSQSKILNFKFNYCKEIRILIITLWFKEVDSGIKQIISILELKWIDTFGFNCYWIPNSKNPYIQCWNQDICQIYQITSYSYCREFDFRSPDSAKGKILI